jgi:hypothetical protein
MPSSRKRKEASAVLNGPTQQLLLQKQHITVAIRELISQNLIQWFHNPRRAHRMPVSHPLYHEAAQQQSIGWNHFLQGRIAISLLQHQENYYRARNRPSKETGQTWAKQLIQLLWAHFFDVWKHRCEARHAQDINRVSLQRTHRAQVHTRAVYAALDQLPAATRHSHHFAATLEEQISHSTHAIKSWLAHTEPLVQQGLVKAAQTLVAGHLDIRDYFLPNVPTLQPD